MTPPVRAGGSVPRDGRLRAAAWVQRMSPLRREAAAFVAGRHAWHWFASLTYGSTVPSISQAGRDGFLWAGDVARQVGGHVIVAVAIGYQTARDVPHLHALVAFPDGTPPPIYVGEMGWHRRGFSSLRLYDPDDIGAWYALDHAEWGVVVGCPRRSRCRRRGGCPVASAYSIPIAP